MHALAFAEPPVTFTYAEVDGRSGPVGASPPSPPPPLLLVRHDPSLLVSLRTSLLCVAYRQPSGPTMTKSPRVPPLMRSRVGRSGLERSMRVIDPLRRLTIRNGGRPVVASAVATAMPSGCETFA